MKLVALAGISKRLKDPDEPTLRKRRNPISFVELSVHCSRTCVEEIATPARLDGMAGTGAEEVETLIPPSARTVIFDLAHAHEIRFAALRALEQLSEEMEHEGGSLWLAGVDADTAALLVRSGSPLRWMPEAARPGESVEQCLERAARSG